MWPILKFTVGATAIERLRRFAAPGIRVLIFIGVSALAAIKTVIEVADYVSK